MLTYCVRTFFILSLILFSCYTFSFSQVLENVRTFTAAADLNIGPHTLSALRFQSTSLNTNSIVYSGNSGVLTTSDKFTYTKGVLAAPAMKVENLLCALDARGNDIRCVCHLLFCEFL